MFGLGLATTLSRVMIIVILLFMLNREDCPIRLSIEKWKIDFSAIKLIVKVGTPAGIEKLVMRLGQLVYVGMIITLGTAFVAHNVAGNIENYSFVIALGFGISATTLVGISIGEKRPERAKSIAMLTNSMTTFVLLLCGVIFFVFAPQLSAIFSETPEVQQLATIVLRLIALFQPFASMTHVFTNALQGAGDTKFPMYTTFIGIWGMRVVLGYFLAIVSGLGLLGFWIGYAMDISLRGILLSIRFAKGKWESIKI